MTRPLTDAELRQCCITDAWHLWPAIRRRPMEGCAPWVLGPAGDTATWADWIDVSAGHPGVEALRAEVAYLRAWQAWAHRELDRHEISGELPDDPKPVPPEGCEP